jgi:hypothetical protein
MMEHVVKHEVRKIWRNSGRVYREDRGEIYRVLGFYLSDY